MRRDLQSPGIDVIPELADALGDEDPEVRADAVRALAFMNAPETMDVLIGALGNGDGSVRLCAAMGLGWLGRMLLRAWQLFICERCDSQKRRILSSRSHLNSLLFLMR